MADFPTPGDTEFDAGEEQAMRAKINQMNQAGLKAVSGGSQQNSSGGLASSTGANDLAKSLGKTLGNAFSGDGGGDS